MQQNGSKMRYTWQIDKRNEVSRSQNLTFEFVLHTHHAPDSRNLLACHYKQYVDNSTQSQKCTRKNSTLTVQHNEKNRIVTIEQAIMLPTLAKALHAQARNI